MSEIKRHMENDLMLRYAIYLEDPHNPDYDGQRLSQADIFAIKSHIEACSACALQLEEIRNDFSDLAYYLDSEGLSGISTHPVRQVKEPAWRILQRDWSGLFTSWRFGIAVAAAAAVVFILFSSLLYIMRSDQPYLSLASITKVDLSANLRSGAGSELHHAILGFQNENYEQAIRRFRTFLADGQQSELHTFAHYYSGLSYLLDSRETLLGVTVDFDMQKVDAGIKHLQQVLELTQNVHYIEDAQWHLAKAYLIKGDKNKAISALTTILEYQGRRRAEAIALLKKLNDSQ